MKKLLSSIALVGALMGQARAQSTNEVAQTEIPSNVVTQVTNTVAAVKTTPTNAVEQVTAQTTNAVEQVTAQTTNAVEQVTAQTTNAIAQVAGSTNAVIETVVSTNSVSTNAVSTVAKKNEAEPQMTDAEKAIIKEVTEQIPAEISAVTNGLPEAQLIALCAGLHMEPRNGTHDIMVDYWKAANAGADVRAIEQDYINRNNKQVDYMRACQEAAADANLNGQKEFTVSGVTFDMDSPQLALNLVKLYMAKEDGKMSVIIDGRPFSIVRTPEEEKMFRKVFDRNTQQYRFVRKYPSRTTPCKPRRFHRRPRSR